jgi:hypothetical protein
VICRPHVPQPKISLRNIPEGYSGTLKTVEYIAGLIKQGAKDFYVRQTAIDILLRRAVRPKDYLGEKTMIGFDTIVVFERPAAGGNIGIGFKKASQFEEFGGGQGLTAIANASVPPTVNLAGVGFCMSRMGRSSIEARMER